MNPSHPTLRNTASDGAIHARQNGHLAAPYPWRLEILESFCDPSHPPNCPDIQYPIRISNQAFRDLWQLAPSFTIMAKRTYESDAQYVETVDDLDDIVQDKREGWRQTNSKARRRQRRYKKRLTHELVKRHGWAASEEDLD